ncbi:hypothetical protein CDAR_562371 [Caerostris darwini]|uniref:ATP synthase F0 subunit 8 n=1 Tax=Caerostris darwini TaxID=1538125 RepID=A0AAV4X7I4_9ARAC|nr:hypothetical protein CDAR_562371 [Caerostris darwini]
MEFLQPEWMLGVLHVALLLWLYITRSIEFQNLRESHGEEMQLQHVRHSKRWSLNFAKERGRYLTCFCVFWDYYYLARLRTVPANCPLWGRRDHAGWSPDSTVLSGRVPVRHLLLLLGGRLEEDPGRPVHHDHQDPATECRRHQPVPDHHGHGDRVGHAQQGHQQVPQNSPEARQRERHRSEMMYLDADSTIFIFALEQLCKL